MECSEMQELYVNEWSSALIKRLEGRRYPLSGTIELTDRCNFNCVHCYINQSAGDKQALASELTTEQYKWLIDQLVEAGTLFVTLTGGEVFLRSDFIEIYNYARRKGLLVTIFTNGSMITPQIVEELAALPPEFVEITLYGATSETYEKVTRVPGSFERCMKGINLFLEKGIKTKLKTMVLDINLHEYEAIRSIAQRLGVEFRHDAILWPRLDHESKNIEHQISIDDVLRLENATKEQRAEWRMIEESFTGEASRAVNVFSCGIGLLSFAIDSKGNMFGCVMYRHVNHNIFDLGFMEAWRRLGEIRNLKRQKVTKCQTCTLGGLCHQCPAWSQAVHGDDETPVEFLCELGHKRVEILKKEYNLSIIQEEL